MPQEPLEAAKIGKMFVTDVTFKYCNASESYNNETGKYDKVPAHWNITATLRNNVDRYHNSSQSMTISVEQGVGQRLAEMLMPVVVADASRKAQQLADDSKAMLAALGDRTIQCITDMPVDTKPAS